MGGSNLFRGTGISENFPEFVWACCPSNPTAQSNWLKAESLALVCLMSMSLEVVGPAAGVKGALFLRKSITGHWRRCSRISPVRVFDVRLSASRIPLRACRSNHWGMKNSCISDMYTLFLLVSRIAVSASE